MSTQSYYHIAAKRFSLSLIVLLLLLQLSGAPLSAQGGGESPDRGSTIQATTEQTLVLGLLNTLPQQLLGELLGQLIREEGHYVTPMLFEDITSLLAALERGTVDLAIVFPVDALIIHHGLPLNALPTDSQRIVQLVDSLAAKADLTWMTPSTLQRRYQFFTANIVDGIGDGIADTLAEDNGSATTVEVSLDAAANSQPATMLLSSLADPTATLCVTAAENALLTSTLMALRESQQQPVDLIDPIIVAADTRLDPDVCTLLFGHNLDIQLQSAALQLLATADDFFPANPPTLVAQRSFSANYPEVMTQWERLVTAVDVERFQQLLGQATDADIQLTIEPVTDTLFVTAILTTTRPPSQTVPNTMTEMMVPELQQDLARNTERIRHIATQFLLEQELIAVPAAIVASSAETTQALLSAILVALLRDAGITVVDKSGILAMADAVAAVETGDADAVIALLGDILTLHYALPLTELPTERENAMQLARSLHEGYGSTLLSPADFSLTRVLLVEEELAGLGITTLSRLARYMNQFDAPFAICLDSDFFSRPVTGLSELETFYGFRFHPDNILLMDEDSIFTAIRDRRCQVTVGTITDGRIVAWDLVPLADDQEFFPSNNPVPVFDTTLLQRYPELEVRLEQALSLIDTATMQGFTRRVELGDDGIHLSGDEESPVTIALEFLSAQQLLVQPTTDQ